MKRFALVSTFTFLAASNLYAQTPVVYPLHIGDEWQYYGIPLMGLTKRVGGEVLMPNGQQYALIQQFSYIGLSGPSYERYDGHRMFTMQPFSQNEVLYYDFSRSVGDTISTLVRADTVDIIMSGYGIVPVFGVPRRQWTFWFRCRDTHDCGEIHTVVDSIGETVLDYVGFGSYEIQGALISGRTYGSLSAVNQNSGPATGYSLSQNYPNPFNPTTVIRYQLSVLSDVRLQIFDVLGREVARLVDEKQAAGVKEVRWDATGFTSGLYIFRLDGDAGNGKAFTETKKLVLLR